MTTDQDSPTTEETALIAAEESDLGAVWGARQELREIAARARRFLGFCSELTDSQIIATVQYAHLIGANLFNGELYAWYDKPNEVFVVCPGYKLYTRWAHEADPGFTYWFEDMNANELEVEDDIGVRCYGQTVHQQKYMVQLLETGKVEYDQIKEMATTSAVGILAQYETTRKLATGWTWRQRAETRAFRNMFNRAFGQPSMMDVARERLGEGVTIIEGEYHMADTGDDTPFLEAEAAAAAKTRLEEEGPEAVLERGRKYLRGGDDANWDEPVVEKVREIRDAPTVRADLRQAAQWQKGRRKDYSDAKPQRDDQSAPPPLAALERMAGLLDIALFGSGYELDKDADREPVDMQDVLDYVWARPIDQLTLLEVQETIKWLEAGFQSSTCDLASVAEVWSIVTA